MRVSGCEMGSQVVVEYDGLEMSATALPALADD
jgi:hypothetical protein